MMPASVASRIRRTERAALMRRMVLLSVPSFIGLAGLSILLLLGLLLRSLSYGGGDFPYPVQVIALPFLLVWFVAMVAQLFTLPVAAVTLFKMLRSGPSENRTAAVALFCVSLAGFLIYAIFAVFF